MEIHFFFFLSLCFSISSSAILIIIAIHMGIHSILDTCVLRSTFWWSILRQSNCSSGDRLSLVLHSSNLLSISLIPISYSLLIFFCLSSSTFSSSSNFFSLKVFWLWAITSFQKIILCFILNIKMLTESLVKWLRFQYDFVHY